MKLKALLLNGRQNRLEYPTLSADLHLLLPAILHLALTDGPVDEPAKVPSPKFPRRAILSGFLRAFFYYPAGALPFTMGPLHE